jgi:cation transport protein ChaC
MDQTFKYLNFREKCGYQLNEVEFFSIDDTLNERENICVCYFANRDNIYYSEEMSLEKIAHQIFRSVGPSGLNKEYLYNLCNTLRSLAQYYSLPNIFENDKHLFKLEEIVKSLEDNKNIDI